MPDIPESNTERAELLKLASTVVAAYVGNNLVPADQVPEVIASVFHSLQTISADGGPEPKEELKPAVSVRSSVKPDHIVCLEDGRKLKTLRRHLRTDHGLTPDEYRARWGLPRDYPMVAPDYTEQRSKMAKKIGLGRKPGESPAKARRKKA